MGVKFGREYEDIVNDLSSALQEVDSFYEFFEMDSGDWEALGNEEKQQLTETLADDIFFALGTEREVSVGKGSILYDQNKHVITVNCGPFVKIVRLV